MYEVKRVDGVKIILATYEHHVITVHENLVQHPRNIRTIGAYTMQFTIYLFRKTSLEFLLNLLKIYFHLFLSLL